MNEHDTRPTPETEAFKRTVGIPWHEFARKLERERDEAKCERDTMLEAVQEAYEFASDILRNYECGIEIDLKCESVLAKLKPFLP